jgi:hypothetical protein
MVRRLIRLGQKVIVDHLLTRKIIDMQIRSVGIDISKTTFHLVA